MLVYDENASAMLNYVLSAAILYNAKVSATSKLSISPVVFVYDMNESARFVEFVYNEKAAAMCT